MKNDRDERTRPHVPTSPEECDPNSATVQRWQPKRLPLREGIAQASWFCRIMYILIVLGTGALNLIYWQKLPDTAQYTNPENIFCSSIFVRRRL